jgi:1-phosphofructokinase
MSSPSNPPRVVTVTLNPAIDRTATIPHFTTGAVNRAEHVTERPGGKGVNVAAALAAYGVRVAATGFLGRDNAAVFETFFTQAGIADHFVRLTGRTRTGIKIVDPSNRETTDINFRGLTPSDSDIAALMRKVKELAAAGVDWFVLAGSLPPGVLPTIYRDLIMIVRNHGCRVALDTSGDPLRLAIDAAPDLIKPNIHELAALLDQPQHDKIDISAAARWLVARGVGLVAISMGADGACLANATGVVHVRPPSIAVSSTVGAGDAMVAGLVAAQLQFAGLNESARLATAFSLHALAQRDSGGHDATHAISALVPSITVSAEAQTTTT